jgi:hypothetical protein
MTSGSGIGHYTPQYGMCPLIIVSASTVTIAGTIAAMGGNCGVAGAPASNNGQNGWTGGNSGGAGGGSVTVYSAGRVDVAGNINVNGGLAGSGPFLGSGQSSPIGGAGTNGARGAIKIVEFGGAING